MNRIFVIALLVGGALMIDSPEAAAHKSAHNVYAPPARHHVETHRARHMPAWLWRDRAFRHWYHYTPLRHNHRIGWHGLYELFLWDQATARYREPRHHRDDHHDRHGKRHHRDDHDDRHGKRRHRQKH